jgi:protein CpxP
MKYSIIFSMLFLTSTLTVHVNAQTTQQDQSTSENPHRRNETERQSEKPKQALTPEQKAQKQADHLQKKLGLSEEQKMKVYDLNLARITQSKALRDKNKSSDNKQGSKEEFQKIRTDYDKGLTSILNDDQQKTWAQMKADAKAKKDAHHAQKGSNGKKPADKPAPTDEDPDNLDVD